MNQEFQRIKAHLSTLLQTMLKSELSNIILMHYPYNILIQNSQSMEISTTHLSERTQIPQQLISDFHKVLLQNFITPIASNIGNIKTQINNYKIENQQLRTLIKQDSIQAEFVRQSIKQINSKKDQLQKQLQELKSTQERISKLINSNCMEEKIKDIMKQNQAKKQQLKQRDQLIQVKLLQIKEYIEKEAFLVSQIRSLQNDNILFHQDLSKAYNQNKIFNQKNNQLSLTIQSMQQLLNSANLNHKQQLNNLNLLFNNQNQTKIVLQQSCKQKSMQIQLLSQQIQKQKKINNDLRQQIVSLRSQIQNYLQKIESLQVLKNQSYSQICRLQKEMQNKKIRQAQLVSQYKLQEKINSQSKQTLNEQIKYLQNQLKLQKDILKLNQAQHQKYKQNQISILQKLSKKHETQINIQRNQQQQRQIKLRQQLGLKISQLQNVHHLLELQKANSQYYHAYLQQNNQLKAQLQRIILINYQNRNIKAIVNKYMFKFMQLRQEIIRIKNQNKNLRVCVGFTCFQSKKWITKQINKFAVQLLEKKYQFQSCQHWNYYEISKKTLQQDKSKINDIKTNKDIKGLKEKYKLLKEQNLLFGQRIKEIIQ